MTANLEFYNQNNELIDLTLESGGIDFGVLRKGVPSIAPIKIKNVGTTTAKRVAITSSTLNEQSQVNEHEYQNQLLAKSWKTFGFSENGKFENMLELGDIKADSWLSGTTVLEDNFSDKAESLFTDGFSDGNVKWEKNMLTFTKTDGTTNGSAMHRVDLTKIGNRKEFDITFNLNTVVDLQGITQSQYPSFLYFLLRGNSNGDGLGYGIQVRISRSKQICFKIFRDGRGIISTSDRQYGVEVANSGYQPFQNNATIRLRLWTNESGLPQFECYYNNTIVDFKTGTVFYVDTDNKYPNKGNSNMAVSMYLGDVAISLSNFKIGIDEVERMVYIKTIIGDGAVDQVSYKSSAEVIYVE